MKLAASIAIVLVTFFLLTGTTEAGFSALTFTPFNGTETQALTNVQVATFNSPDPIGNLSATIDWGDGFTTPSTITSLGAGAYKVTGTHTYAEDGTYTVTVTVTDTTGGGSTQAVSGSAVIGEQSLSITALVATVTEGQNTAINTATASDPGSPDPGSAFTATIDWGDGTISAGNVVAAGGGNYSIFGVHMYADEGSFTVSTTFFETNEPGFSVTAANTVTVQEGDVLTPHAMTLAGTEGAAFSGAVATFTDTYTANPASDFTATIDWGDGTPVTAGTISGSAGNFTVSGSHTYARFGTYTVGVTMADDAPGTATATANSTMTVSDVALSATGLTFAVNVNVSSTVKVAHFTDANPTPTLSDFSATIDWGDGSALSAGTITAGGGGFDVSGTHTYLTGGTFTVPVLIHDLGGANTTVNATGKAGADLSVIKTGPGTVVSGANLTYSVTVTNLGPADATGVTLSDVVPAGTTFVSATQGSGPAFSMTLPPVGSAGTMSFSIATLTAGTSAGFTEVVKVNGGTPAGTNIANTATVSAATSDPVPGNNSSSTNTIVTPGTAPSITSAPSTTFAVGFAGSFLVTTTGSPAPAITRTGTLPTGVSFTDNGNGTATLAGTPAAGTAGTYPLVFTAANGTAPNAVQNFTLSVGGPTAPVFTSAPGTTFTAGQAGSFTVTASGIPSPTFTLTGALPSGMTFNGATGVLSGTPGAATAGSYALTITALNGVAPNAIQAFTLTVVPPCPIGNKGCVPPPPGPGTPPPPPGPGFPPPPKGV